MPDIGELLAERAALKVKNSQDLGASRLANLKDLQPPTQRLYSDLQVQWEKFKNEILNEPHAEADVENAQIFFYWYAEKSKGKLAERSTITTLLYKVGRFGCMYNRLYTGSISHPMLDVVREYVKTDLAKRLGLSDAEYEKECCDWKDIEIIIRYLIEEDPHKYRDNRYRAQMLWLFLIISDDGERIGAITRSDCYRDEEIALCYQDVKLYLRPTTTANPEPEFKLEIRFNNRKGERGDPRAYLEQTYLQRVDYPHCAVLVFLVLAFLDNAFEDFETASDLFALRNLGSSDFPIRIKQKMMPIPILRRALRKGSRELSPILPLSATTATSDAKRIFRARGFPQRFTFYNPRRGVSNAISDRNIPAPRIKQLMGHSGPSDKVYRRFYQSRKFTVDTGNIFRGEEQRQGKSEVLSMHLKLDVDAPNVVPAALQDQILDADEKIQELLRARSEIGEEIDQLGSDVESAYDQVTLKLARERIRRVLCYRRSYIKKQSLAELRASHFLRGPKLSPVLPRTVACGEARRSDLVKALYPLEGEGCALNAVETFIAYCINDSTDNEPTDDDSIKDDPSHQPIDEDPYCRESGSEGEFELLAAPRPQPHSKQMDMTPDDTQLIFYLREENSLPWEHVKAHFPGRSKESLRTHYNLRKEIVERSTRKIWTREEDCMLRDLKENTSMSWKQIATEIPGTIPETLKKHYKYLKDSSVTTSQQPVQGLQVECAPSVLKRCRNLEPIDDQPGSKRSRFPRGTAEYRSRVEKILASEGKGEKLKDRDYVWIRALRNKGEIDPKASWIRFHR